MGIFETVIDKTKELRSDYEQRKRADKEDWLNVKEEKLDAREKALNERDRELQQAERSLAKKEQFLQQKERKPLYVLLACIAAVVIASGYIFQNYEFTRRVALKEEPKLDLENGNVSETEVSDGPVPSSESAPSYAPESTSQSMSFDKCLLVIQRTATDLAVAPINIVETEILRIVRFPTSDGSVLATCSKLDEKLILTRSKK